MEKPVILIGMNNQEWKPLPTEKSYDLDHAITAIFGIDRRASVEHKRCATCSTDVELDSFKDELSLKEFHISGMCQSCQDEIFS